MIKPRNRSQLLPRITLGVITAILTISIATSFYTFGQLSRHTDEKFSTDTKALTQNILDSIRQYESILYDSRLFLTTHPDMTQGKWKEYFAHKGIYEGKGISSISYIQLIPHADKETFMRQARTSGDFPPDFTIKPAGDREQYAVARWVSSGTNVRQALGFDVFSTPDRKRIYDMSEKLNRPVASEPFVLATGVSGFFITLPIKTIAGITEGFITMSFHTSAFMTELTRKTTTAHVATRVTDITHASHRSLYESADWQTVSPELTRSDTVAFSGRYWSIEMKSGRGYEDSLLNYALPRAILLGGGAVVLCIVIVYATVERKRAARRR